MNLQRKLPDILEAARHAPSVHNTQPWLVSADASSITVKLNPEFLLSDGDPTGRETVISMGIFAEALMIGAVQQGFELLNIGYRDQTVQLEFKDAKTALGAAEDIRLLKSRCTDRSIYRPVNIPDETLRALTNSWPSRNVGVTVTTDKNTIGTIASLTSKGIRLALTSPSFRRELSRYLVRPLSRRKRGIATRSLYIPWLVQIIEPWLMRYGIGLNAEANLEKRRWLSSSGVAVISADGDMPEHWFEAGRAYLRLSLAIEKAGLSQATSAAIVEASDFHEDIEKLLGIKRRILCMIRIGKGKKNRHHSPRLSVRELIDSTSN